MPGGGIYHFGAVRYRVIGEGNLVSTLTGMIDSYDEELADLTLEPTTLKEPIRLANFKSQRAKLKVQVNEIDEWFQFNTIILFVKLLYTGFPVT